MELVLQCQHPDLEKCRWCVAPTADSGEGEVGIKGQSGCVQDSCVYCLVKDDSSGGVYRTGH